MKKIHRFVSFLFVLLAVANFFNGTDTQSQTPIPLPPAFYPQASVRPSRLIILHRQKQASIPQQALTVYNCGDPSNDEQYYLELLNRARANPTAEGMRIDTTTDPNVSFEFTYWDGQDANEPTRAKIKSDFATYTPKQPLAMNASLLAAARAHSQDMLQNNYQGHQGTDGSWPQDRAHKAGYSSQYVGENAFAYSKNVFDAHCNWLIDFGVPNDTQWGHRNNCLEFKTGNEAVAYSEVGPGMVPGGSGAPDVGPLVCTLDLGDAGKNFILGVVYNDANHNGFYDPGEGVSGVAITASGGTYSAVTSTSGGYAIPYSGSGSVKVTAAVTGGSLSQTINFDAQNVKVDFIVNGFPGEVTLLTPSIDTTVNSSATTFTWAMDTGATTYHIQVGTDTAMTKSKLVVNDSTVTGLSKQVTGLKDTFTYYWRMRAKNSRGWGVFSPVQSFSVALAPNRVVVLAPASSATVPGDVPVVFSWQPSTPRVTNYWLQVAKNGGMTPPFVISDTIDASMTSETVQFSRLQGNTTYYWQVLAQNDGGWSQPSIMRTFSTSTSSVNPDIMIPVVVSVSPNPASGFATFHYTTNSDPVTLRIYNSLGIEVNSASLGQVSWGSHEYHLDCSGLAAGEYMYQMTVGHEVRTGHFVLVR